jgi:hypothetical protein
MRRLTVGGLTLLLALALANAALAIGPGQKAEGYQGPGEAVQGQVQQGEVAAAQVGALPFTGLDLTLLAVAGAVLIIVGAGFFRLSRRRQ